MLTCHSRKNIDVTALSCCGFRVVVLSSLSHCQELLLEHLSTTKPSLMLLVTAAMTKSNCLLWKKPIRSHSIILPITWFSPKHNNSWRFHGHLVILSHKNRTSSSFYNKMSLVALASNLNKSSISILWVSLSRQTIKLEVFISGPPVQTVNCILYRIYTSNRKRLSVGPKDWSSDTSCVQRSWILKKGILSWIEDICHFSSQLFCIQKMRVNRDL